MTLVGEARSQPEPCTDTAANILLLQERCYWVWEAPRTEHTDAVSATSLTFTSPCGAAMSAPSGANTAHQRACGGWWSRQNHHRFTVDLELLSNTKNVQEQKVAITLTLFGPPRDTPTTTERVGAFVLIPPWASRRIGRSRQGHPRCTDARKGRPWVALNTIHSATKRAQPAALSSTTYNDSP